MLSFQTMDLFEDQDDSLFQDLELGEVSDKEDGSDKEEELADEYVSKAAKSLSALLLPNVNHPGSVKYHGFKNKKMGWPRKQKITGRGFTVDRSFVWFPPARTFDRLVDRSGLSSTSR